MVWIRVCDGGVTPIAFSAPYRNGPYFLFQRLLESMTQILKEYIIKELDQSVSMGKAFPRKAFAEKEHVLCFRQSQK